MTHTDMGVDWTIWSRVWGLVLGLGFRVYQKIWPPRACAHGLVHVDVALVDVDDAPVARVSVEWGAGCGAHLKK